VRTETHVAIELAQGGEARFIPLRVAECRPPALWRAFQWIPFAGRYAAGLAELLAALTPQAAGPAETVPAQPRAPQTGSVGDRPERGSPPGTRPEPVEGPRSMPAAASTSSASVSSPKPVQGPPAVLTLTAPIRLELVRIPAGEFLMGSNPTVDKDADADEQPQHRLYLPDFYIGKVPVTNAQFAAFAKAVGYKTQAEERGFGWAWTESQGEWLKGADWCHPRGPQTGIAEKADHPVVQVSWHDAVAFCRWLSEATGQPFRLPSEAEWEKAARGPVAGSAPSTSSGREPTGSGRGRIYPWGDEPPDKARCNFGQNVGDTTPVGQYAAGETPDTGVLDLAGNVWEWTGSLWGKYWQGPDFGYPYDPNDGREDQAAPDSVFRVLRGGSWSASQLGVRCAIRNWDHPDPCLGGRGFRVVRSSP
jgi:formylglycine-generating enzyme required for sulfatase activity